MEAVASLWVGFDAGSTALKVVVADEGLAKIRTWYRRTHGRPVETAIELFREIQEQYAGRQVSMLAGTGSAGRLICELLSVPCLNEVICQAVAVRHLHPNVRTVIEMGGQDSKLLFLSEDPTQPIADFAMNTNCAAGTGSFLDQQATRLGIRIEDEFGDLALRSQNPPRVAGRCSVFAKSDMIHLQQMAAPMHDIVAGLCLGLARNLKSNLGRGMELAKPVAFCGGVAANKGVVRAIQQACELKEDELIVPEHFACTGALGAILLCRQERSRHSESYGQPASGTIDLQKLTDHLNSPRSLGYRLQPLEQGGGVPDPARSGVVALKDGEVVDAWLGLDVGSISTKAAVVDSQHRVLAKVYLMTAGRPLDAVRKVLTDIGRQVEGKVRIRGAATTGSGRYLTGDFIGADMVINEITAQATAAAVIDPNVDTIFEIGGQDSKYISLDGGVVVDFEMNHACAAGTGSFLEEQAERLHIDIKRQFADLAFASSAPIRLGERCTVFMESDMVSYQQQGAATQDLVAGLCYSIVSNYINRVVGRRRIGKHIFFQGGTAFNKGVVAAFERFTGRRITVPPHHEVTGAIGAAVLAKRYQETHGHASSKFGGFALADLKCEVRSFECTHCSNNCEINEVCIAGRELLFYGSRCDRYNLKKQRDDHRDIPNLFAERHRLLIQHAQIKTGKPGAGQKTIGIPMALSNYQLLPLWGTLLHELGFHVVLSGASTDAVVHAGVDAVLSTPCFPVKVAHGHVLALLEKGVSTIWLPSVITMPKDAPEIEYNQLCPYVSSIPYQVTAALQAQGRKVRIVMPAVHMEHGEKELYRCLKTACDELGVSDGRMRQAIGVAWQAQRAFEDACRARGKEVLHKLPADRRALVLVSRPYNGCDPGVSLDVPTKLRRLGVLPIPMDFLDLRLTKARSELLFQAMYWKYGQRILRAAQIVAENPKLHAVYLSNFGCGPDSFLISYFKRLMAPKPSLVLEIDEHSADAGVVTRLEAFLESLDNAGDMAPAKRGASRSAARANGDGRRIFVPWMGDSAHAVVAAMRACGQQAEIIPLADEQSLELGRRHCTGKECLPCLITTGDMLRLAQEKSFDPQQSAFLMPGGSGPCRFGQYSVSQRIVLDDLGLHDVPIVSPSHDQQFYEDWKHLGGDFTRRAWVGIAALDVLTKACLATRPYETSPGQTDRLYVQWRDKVLSAVESRADEDDLLPVLRSAAKAFADVPIHRSRRRPKIGVVGENYVRHHDFANNNLIRRIEQLGGEAVVASFAEYMYYTNWTRKDEAWRKRNFRHWGVNLIQDFVQKKIHGQMAKPFEQILGTPMRESRTEVLLKHGQQYLDPSFQAGEAMIAIGRIVELYEEGCCGVVNVMPFGCMPSTIVMGLMKQLSTACGGIPALSISYDGQQDPTLSTRLEALIYQAQAYLGRNGKTPRRHGAKHKVGT